MMKISNSNNSNVSFGALHVHSAKTAQKIGGRAMTVAIRKIEQTGLAEDIDLHIIPKKGLLTKIEGFLFVATKKGEKWGSLVELMKDPKKYLDADSDFGVKRIKAKDIYAKAVKAADVLAEGNPEKCDAPLGWTKIVPTDLALINPTVQHLGKRLFGINLRGK